MVSPGVAPRSSGSNPTTGGCALLRHAQPTTPPRVAPGGCLVPGDLPAERVPFCRRRLVAARRCRHEPEGDHAREHYSSPQTAHRPGPVGVPPRGLPRPRLPHEGPGHSATACAARPPASLGSSGHRAVDPRQGLLPGHRVVKPVRRERTHRAWRIGATRASWLAPEQGLTSGSNGGVGAAARDLRPTGGTARQPRQPRLHALVRCFIHAHSRCCTSATGLTHQRTPVCLLLCLVREDMPVGGPERAPQVCPYGPQAHFGLDSRTGGPREHTEAPTASQKNSRPGARCAWDSTLSKRSAPRPREEADGGHMENATRER